MNSYIDDYIIDHPQLQSLQKRMGSLLVWAVCWLMWVYLLIPLVTLGEWLLGDYAMNAEMRWFGGYSSLLQLLKMFLATLLVQMLLWLCWVFFRARRRRRFLAASGKVVDDRQLCAFYQVNRDELQCCRDSSLITVYFDELGNIVHLEPGLPDGERQNH
ncbi:MAG: poly-beta-1,6-N-acetyl-D-glucosamine biosynthesis protein PgaD [Methylovulum sp.]|nr:poly-beta-1,6-N-acetyl-D-glucosamine biosynthesis protein PgaD [Methylovulum sp.]